VDERGNRLRERSTPFTRLHEWSILVEKIESPLPLVEVVANAIVEGGGLEKVSSLD